VQIGNRQFEIGKKTYVMGILNVTPDSFSDGGKWNHIEDAIRQAERMLAEGADILDIGGESTRPGHTPVDVKEEIARVIPIIKAIKERFDVPVSVDTWKSEVAKEALEAGADMINDIWGLQKDKDMAAVISEYNAACVIMHNREDGHYDNLVENVVSDLKRSIAYGTERGIARDKILVDPGIGFAKTPEENLLLLNHLEQLSELSCPVLLGTSRKSVIGYALDLPVEERLEGTLATTVLGVIKGCAFVRVHDVKENVRVIRMTEAVLGKR